MWPLLYVPPTPTQKIEVGNWGIRTVGSSESRWDLGARQSSPCDLCGELNGWGENQWKAQPLIQRIWREVACECSQVTGCNWKPGHRELCSPRHHPTLWCRWVWIPGGGHSPHSALLGLHFLSFLPQQWKLIRWSLDSTSSFAINYYFSKANSQCSVRGLLNCFTFSTFSNRWY